VIPQYLSDQDFAELFVAANHVASGEDVLELEPRVESWLSRSGMSHRNAFAVAVQVAKIARPRVESPEEAARLHDLHEGVGDSRPPAIGPTDDEMAARIRDMSLAEFSRERQRLGLGSPNTLDFLGGS
jgi:hypothetical protein